MLLPLLLVGLVAFQSPPAEKPPVPDADRAKVAVAELRAAFDKNDAGPRIRAIESAGSIADPEVVRQLGRGLADRDLAVQKAAIEALRFNTHEKGLDELLARAKVKAAKDDLSLYALLLRAIGQHGDPRAIAALSENPWAAPDGQVIQAKILGLGRIRTNEALKAITDLMEVAGPHKIQAFMKDFRLALWSLTGSDQGESAELWQRWYRENKSKLKIAPEPRDEPSELARRWKAYWANPKSEAGAKKERPRDGGTEGGVLKRRRGENGAR